MAATPNGETREASPGERPPAATRRPSAAPSRRIGVVLGAGAARGWAHIGALQALRELGVQPSVVVGCSSGAVVGASYVTGELDALEAFARSLTWRGVLGYFDFSWRGGGLIEGRWLVDFFRRYFHDVAIQDVVLDGAPIRFGAVATELDGGREAWLTSGPIIDAVRASIALPGLVTPIAVNGHWMVDGALVNPVPVSLCRALGAEVILAVSMQGDLVTNGRARSPAPPPAPLSTEARSSWLAWLSSSTAWAGSMASSWRGYWHGARPAADAVAVEPVEAESVEAESVEIGSVEVGSADVEAAPVVAPAPGRDAAATWLAAARPGYFQVMSDSFFIVQNFVSRVRLAADPVDLLIAPDVEQIGILDFHRGAEAIDAGRAAVERRSEEIRRLCGLVADV